MSKLIFYILMVVSATGFAQDVVEDIRKINMFFLNDNLALDLTYDMYPDSVSLKPFQSEKGKWIKSGKAQYNLLGKLESIRKGGEMQVIFDHDNKMAVLSNAPVVAGDETDLPGLSNLKDMIDQCSAIKYRNVSGQLAAYDLYPKGSEFSKITVVFDKKKFSPSKVVVFYANHMEYSDDGGDKVLRPRMEVSFKVVSMGGAEKLLDLKTYIVARGNSYELAPRFKEYQLNNYLITN